MKKPSPKDIRSLVRPSVRRLRAYPAQEIPCTVKLDANESPYGPPRDLMNRIARRAAELELNRYPDPEAFALRKALVRQLRVPAVSLLLGNGSDELISSLITTFGGPVQYPVPTFAMYRIIAQAQGLRTREISLDETFDIPAEAFLKDMGATKPKLVFLSSPNNPTGNGFSTERIRAVIEQAPGIVVVDEAYQPFSKETSWLKSLSRYPNLAVLRTLSKVGLAGLRLGILAASEDIVSEVNKVRLPFNVNSFSQAAALESLEDPGKFLRTVAGAVRRERKHVARRLRTIPGVRAYPSDANFIFFTVQRPAAVYGELLRRGVLIRSLDSLVPGGMRVTIGTPEENAAFLDALKEVME